MAGADDSVSSEAEGEAGDLVEVNSIDPREVLGDDLPELDERTGLPKVLKAYVVHKEPEITLVPNFLSECEVEHLIELSQEFWVPSVVGAGVYKTNDEMKDLANKPSKNRTSFSCMLRSAQTPEVDSLEHRLALLAGMDVEYLERLNMVRYEPGQLFNRHHDGRFRPKTVFIYLNDLPEGAGGETLFSDIGVQIVPRKGCAVMWSNTLSPSVEDPRTYHQGLPPRCGIKYGVNCFFNDKPLKQWEDVDSDFGDEEGVKSVGKATSRYHSFDPTALLEEPHADLKPGQIRSFTISSDPRVSVIPEFATVDEVAALISMTDPQVNGRRPAGADDMFRRLEHRISLAAGLPIAHMDPLRVAKCEPNMTPDGRLVAKDQYRQKFGVKVVYMFLNDVEDGGELRFPKLGLQVRPRQGTAVVFAVGKAGDTRAVHQGRPPKTGMRYCAIAVFREEPVRGTAAAQQAAAE